jgi:hypothetical protein
VEPVLKNSRAAKTKKSSNQVKPNRDLSDLVASLFPTCGQRNSDQKPASQDFVVSQPPIKKKASSYQAVSL